MALLEVKDLKKTFNGETLFENVSFNLNIEDKMGLIGSNGAGKTTLLKIILDEIPHDDGTVHLQNNRKIGYLSQVMIHSFENTLMEEMLISFEDVIKLEEDLNNITIELANNPDNKDLLRRYGNIENKFLSRGGYDYHYLIDLMISKFGFSTDDYDRKIGSFSGGERNKIAFTKLLLAHPDILILDEPTNHLDVETIEWLEEYLHNYDGAVIIVSHDRYFIDSVCNCILEISNQSSEYYRGNYSFYLQEKVNRYERKLQEYNLQEKEIAHLKSLIARFKPKPTKTSLAKDREKKLARIMDNKLDKPKQYKPQVHFNIQSMELGRCKQLTLQDLTFGYDNNPLCSNELNMTIFYGDKVGIIGNNGTGKTTLLKTIAEFLQPINGLIHKHRKLNMGYIDQNQIQIDSELTVFDYFHERYPSLTNYDIRHHLGSFLFQQDDVFKTVNDLSGGEKVRLSFSLLVLKKYDILLLDEPTNHLDIETRKVLESALRDYEGTIIFVSHDRYFISELADRLISFKNGETSIFEGDYNEFIDYNKKNINLKKEQIEEVKAPKSETIKEKKPKKVNIKKLEEELTKKEEELAHLNELLYEEEYYTDRSKLEALEDEIVTKENEYKHLEEEYLTYLE